MSKGGKRQPSSATMRLWAIVWDRTVGSGNNSETITDADWRKMEDRWGRGFTPEERDEVKETWAKCLQEMHSP